MSDALHAVATRHAATLPMLLLSAWQLVLHRRLEAPDIVVALASNGRERHERSRLVGPAAGLLPIRSDLTGMASVHDLLDHVRHAVLGAVGHQDLPLGTIVPDGRVAASLTVTPENRQPGPFGDLELTRVVSLPAHDEGGHSAIALHVACTPAALEATVSVRDPRVGAESLMDDWRWMLDRIATNDLSDLAIEEPVSID